MNRRATIKDVAARARVATGTVSRVMNGDTTVHPVIREAVEAAIKELDYRPSPMARNLRRGTSGTLGFVLGDITNPTYSPSIPVVQELTRAAGYAVIVMDSGLDKELERKNLDLLVSLRVDGIVWNPLLPVTSEIPAILRGVPVVSFPGVAAWEGPKVSVRSAAATLEALEDFLSHGHKTIALLTIRGLGGTQRDLLKEMTLRTAAAGACLVSDASWTFNSRRECAAALPAKLAAPDRPTAILVASAVLPELLIAVREAGLKIPRDLSVVSIAASELAEVYDPAIGVVSFDHQRFASEAIRKLLAAIRGEDLAEDAEPYQSAYVPRASVGPAPRA